MDAQQFAYWLKGWMELQNPQEISMEQTQMIKDHLDLVFNKVTPNRPAININPPAAQPSEIHYDRHLSHCSSDYGPPIAGIQYPYSGVSDWPEDVFASC